MLGALRPLFGRDLVPGPHRRIGGAASLCEAKRLRAAV